jgi:NAD(P)-dependent dehydrogenase (short-subunit alcohol dehydrogenase family)
MLQQGGGVIVNTSSVAGLVGFTNLPAYVASKHGIAGLTRTAAVEYAQQGIRVNAVCPGVIHTPMVDRIVGGDAEAAAQFTALEPVGRMGSPAEVAQAVVWLCSDAASFVTGSPCPSMAASWPYSTPGKSCRAACPALGARITGRCGATPTAGETLMDAGGGIA